MKFLLELNVNFDKLYRLQQDQSWRCSESYFQQSFLTLSDTDQLFLKLEHLRPYFKQKKVNIEGEEYSINQDEIDVFGGRNAFLLPKVYRLTVPLLPSREELTQVIAEGDDRQNNALIIDLEGHFKLMGFSRARRVLAPIAVRNEAYVAGNGYVGIVPAQDAIFLEREYLSLLEGWVSHLHSGRLDIFVDESTQRKEKDILTEIEELSQKIKGSSHE